MSEDIRKMIDKVKNFKQFVNENYNNNIIDFILDKINNYGIETLSNNDKDVLNGIYKNKKINVNEIENKIFILLCEDEEKDNILMDIEEDYDIHSYYILPIYGYCKKVYENIKTLFEKLKESPSLISFFETYVSYNTNGYLSLFNNKDWAVAKSFKESFENEDIYFEEDVDFDNMSQEIINCFNI